jgi:hypothetical protein
MLSKLVSLKQTEGAASTFALTTPLMEAMQKINFFLCLIEFIF